MALRGFASRSVLRGKGKEKDPEKTEVSPPAEQRGVGQGTSSSTAASAAQRSAPEVGRLPATALGLDTGEAPMAPPLMPETSSPPAQPQASLAAGREETFMEQNKDLSTAQLFHLCQKLAAMKTPTQPSRGLPATPDEAAARSNYQPSPLGESRPARTYGTDPLVMHVLLPVAQNKRRWYRVCEHSERTQLQSAVGEKQAPLLECYAFWRYLLSVLVAHHARGDFKLVAVRLSSQAAVAQWLNWGGKSSTDSDGSLTIELDGLTAEGKQALVREGALQHVAEGFWDFRGNTGDLRPIHRKDLWPSKVLSSYPDPTSASDKRRGPGFNRDDDRTLLVAFQTYLKAFPEDIQSEQLERIDSPLVAFNMDRAHVIPSMRGTDVYDSGFLVREQCSRETAYAELSVDRSSNAILLDTGIHGCFDRRELYFLPYPNVGWLAPGKPRPIDDDLADMQPAKREVRDPESPDGKRTYVELPPAERLEIRYRTPRAQSAGLAAGYVPPPALAGIPEAFHRHVKVPAAAFAYSSVAAIMPRLISEELRDWIGIMNKAQLKTKERDIFQRPAQPPRPRPGSVDSASI